uniref:ATPase AAA-type core domain-containing protein n=1 Tax=viral metagenome TaxID=1070528 RepID=A0A6C0BAR2_9ZZZZ
MELIFQKILNRDVIKQQVVDFLKYFDANKRNILTKRCIYIHGPTGAGKTKFIMDILKELLYDVINYDACDTRTKDIIDNISTYHSSDSNVISLFTKKKTKIAIVMDDIECMNNGDKGGINTLIKLIRPKKTKRQKLEGTTHIPVICIGNNYVDKKVKELMKCCTVIELKAPTTIQVKQLLQHLIPGKPEYSVYVDRDLKKIMQLYTIVQNNKINQQYLPYLFEPKPINEDSKQITKRIINNPMKLKDHSIMNDTDRTIVSLLWHENIIDLFEKMNIQDVIPLYVSILDLICFSDYIDRITFQKQIWMFNEMSSILKTFYTNYLFQQQNTHKISDIRFTKVLTKYSTEYNNIGFIQRICKELNMDKKDMFSYIQQLRKIDNINIIMQQIDHTDITLLDIQRIFRFMDKNS